MIYYGEFLEATWQSMPAQNRGRSLVRGGIEIILSNIELVCQIIDIFLSQAAISNCVLYLFKYKYTCDRTPLNLSKWNRSGKSRAVIIIQIHFIYHFRL